jgi:hypothetical protein
LIRISRTISPELLMIGPAYADFGEIIAAAAAENRQDY